MVPNSFGNRNFMQPMGRLSMHSKCLDFFSFKFAWGGGGGGVFFFFLFFSNVFPSFFTKKHLFYISFVPNVFPMVVPNSTLL